MNSKTFEKIALIILLILWYIPRQTAPDGILEKYIILRWVIIPIVLLFIFLLTLDKVISKKAMDFGGIGLPIALFSVFSIISGVVNNINLLKIIGFLLLYLNYPILYICFINLYKPNLIDETRIVLKKILKFFFALLTMQIPECLYRYFFLKVTGDFISYTLGPWGSTDLGFYMLYASSIIFAFYLVKKINILSILIFIPIFLFISIVGEIKAYYLSLLIVFIVIYYRFLKSIKFSIRYSIALVIVFALVLNLLPLWQRIFFESYLYKFINSLSMLFSNPDEIVYESGFNRISAGIITLQNQISDGFRYIILGYGPGSSLAGNFIRSENLLIIKGWTIEQFINQFAVMFADVGVVGFITYLWLLFKIVKIINFSIRLEDNFVKGVSLGLYGIWFCYVFLAPWYSLPWRLDSASYLFYLFTSLIYIRSKFDAI